MNITQLAKLGYIFNLKDNGVFVQYEYHIYHHDGWDIDLSDYGEYPDLYTAIKEINSDIVFNAEFDRLEQFFQIANDRYSRDGDFGVYLYCLMIFIGERLSLKNRK